jgi:hypothetical protein
MGIGNRKRKKRRFPAARCLASMIYVVTGFFCFFGSNTHAMKESGFRELHVWKRSRDLAVLIYRITESSSYKRDAGLRDQCRASVSIASNIAEGDERSTN